VGERPPLPTDFFDSDNIQTTGDTLSLFTFAPDAFSSTKRDKYPLNQTAMKTPQCHLLQTLGFAPLKSSAGGSNTSRKMAAAAESTTTASNLIAVPDDVLFQILLHCGPREVDESVKFVCRRLQ
jgi:hypothetical protein